MKKHLLPLLMLLMLSALLTGCKAGNTPVHSVKTTTALLTESEASSTEQPTEKDEGNESSSLEEISGEMTLEEIEAELGYGYLLPDESLYTGTIVSRLEKPAGEAAYISLEYTSDVFTGVVYVTKKRTEDSNTAAPEVWPELVDAGTKTIDGVEIHFLGYTQYDKIAAYWDENSFSYTVKGDLDTTPAMIPLIRLFMEKGTLDIDPAETVNTELEHNTEMTVEEIETELGFGYQLPDEREYNGEITYSINKNHDKIVLTYSSEEFFGQVIIWKSVKGETDEYDTWSQWPEAGEETINGRKVRFRGNSSDDRGIAFWEQNGYQYVMNCVTAPGADIMLILPLFFETD